MAVDEKRIKEFLGAFPDEFSQLSETQQRVSTQIYRLLAETGEPVPVAELAATLDLPLETVEHVVGQWPGLYYDEDKAIIGYWGLGLQETPHRFEVDGQTLYTWCAWESLFIPQIIGKTAHVVSTDPLSEEQISITVSPYGVVSISPDGAVTSFLMPDIVDQDEIRADVIASFCHYLYFFSSEATAREWIGSSDKSADLVILSIEEGFGIGADKNKLQYKGLLSLESSAAV